MAEPGMTSAAPGDCQRLRIPHAGGAITGFPLQPQRGYLCQFFSAAVNLFDINDNGRMTGIFFVQPAVFHFVK